MAADEKPTRERGWGTKRAYAKGYRVTENGVLLSPKGRVLRSDPDGRGYLRHHVSVQQCPEEGRLTSNVGVHVLAAYQWFGEALFTAGIQVRHLDSNKLNNSRENLAIGTASENNLDKPQHVRARAGVAAAAKLRKLTKDQVVVIRRLLAAKHSNQVHIAAIFDTSQRTVSAIKTRQKYADIVDDNTLTREQAEQAFERLSEGPELESLILAVGPFADTTHGDDDERK